MAVQIPHGNGQFSGGKGHPIVKYRDTSAVICGKTAEPIEICAKMAETCEMPFGLWTRWAQGSRWCPDPPCKWAVFTGKDMPGHARRCSTVSCAKMAELIDLPLGDGLGLA